MPPLLFSFMSSFLLLVLAIFVSFSFVTVILGLIGHKRNPDSGFLAKWRQRNERRNSILMTRHYPDLGSASDWLNQISHAARPIRSTAQIWVVTRHQYGISALVSQTSFGGETSGSVAKCRLFSQANLLISSKTVKWLCTSKIKRDLFVAPTRIRYVSFSDFIKSHNGSFFTDYTSEELMRWQPSRVTRARLWVIRLNFIDILTKRKEI